MIEDDTIVANIYSNKFRIEGYTVEIEADGQAGLEAIKTYKPDIVILDLMLPKMGGLDVIKKVRATPELARLPVVVFSNSYLSNMVQDAWKAGATNCLVKSSCTPKDMLEVIRRNLENMAGSNSPAAAPSRSASTAAGSMADLPSYGISEEEEEIFQKELRKTFLDSLPQHTAAFRACLQSIIKAEADDKKLSKIFELYRKTHGLMSNAALAGLKEPAKLLAALEALLKELHDKPDHLNNSALRTVAQTVDFFSVLVGFSINKPDLTSAKAKILVVDDEALSRRALAFALEKGGLESISIENPMAALKLLEENTFDLIFLDVDMPEINGFDLCQTIRKLPNQAKTPVVFVTGQSDFESRARSAISGGNDLIGKPFLFMEITVKALTHILKGRMQEK